MASEEGDPARCTAEQKAATSTEGTLGSCTTQQNSPTDGEHCSTEPDQEAVPELQADEADEYPADGYEDEAEEDYDQDDAEEYYEEEYYDDELQLEEQRPEVRAVLLSFPEAATLERHELDAAVERVLEQSKPEYANVAAAGKIRLLKEDIKLALVDQCTPPPPSILHNLASNDMRSAESIRRWEELDKEFMPLYGKVDQDRERFRAKVRNELVEKGYVEVDDDYYEKKDECEREMRREVAEEWEQLDFSRFLFANNEDGICYYSEEHGGYI